MNTDPLDVPRIRQQLTGLSVGRDIRYLDRTDSTNRVARELAADDWVTGTVIMTDFQEAGRGRKGRSWSAPPGTSLLLSVLLDLPAHVAAADAIMATTLAVADAATEATGVRATVKWPNDVMLRGKKVSGILAEYAVQENRRRAILGIGLNVNFDPETFEVPGATSLSLVAGGHLDREVVAVTLLRQLDIWLGALFDTPILVFQRWAERLDTIGREVTVVEAGGSWNGVATGVDRSGGLEVRVETGETRRVFAADVSIRAKGGFTST